MTNVREPADKREEQDHYRAARGKGGGKKSKGRALAQNVDVVYAKGRGGDRERLEEKREQKGKPAGRKKKSQRGENAAREVTLGKGEGFRASFEKKRRKRSKAQKEEKGDWETRG